MAFVCGAGVVAARNKTSAVCVRMSGEMVVAGKGAYEGRSFAEVLPKSWAGDMPSVGAWNEWLPKEEPLTEEQVKAFSDYNNMVAAERAAAMAAKSAAAAVEGRPTCGEEGGKFVSNSNPVLVSGVKCVEYWRK